MSTFEFGYPQEKNYKPADDSKLIIAISAGHGGIKPGGCANGLMEKDLTLDFTYRIGHNIKFLSDNKIDVLYVRPTEEFVDFPIRIRKARNANCKLFLDIHTNAAGAKSANGIEAFISPEGNFVEKSKTLATNILHNLMSIFNKNRGVKYDYQSQYNSLYVLRNYQNKGIGVLIELGYITGDFDVHLLKDKKHREEISVNIAKTLVEFFS